MNSQMRTNLLLAILIGTLGNFLFWLLNHSLNTWFTEPLFKSDYIKFYITFCLAAFTIGSILVINSPNQRFWKVSLIVLLLLTLTTIGLGLFFTFDIRTEEFIIYFLAIQLVWLVFLIVLGIYLRYLIQSNLTERQKKIVILSGMFWLFVINSLLLIATRAIFGITDLLIFTPIILGCMLWVSMKSDKSGVPEEVPEERSFKGFGIKKKLGTVILSLAFLISIFFVVSANIRAQLAEEQKQMSEFLAEEAIRLQQMAEREAARAFTERADLQRQLEQCMTNK